jgi:nucleotide-binding universal stress UspA family protein
VRRLSVVATLRPGASARAAALIAAGPPFDPKAVGLTRHAIHLTGREVVFSFEGQHVERALSRIVNDPANAGALAHWAPLVDGTPRLARERFHWSVRDERNRKEKQMKTILIATDGSPASEAAVAAGLDLAAETDARTVLVHVTDPLELPFGRFGPGTPVPTHELADTGSVPALVAAAAQAQERGVPHEEKLVAGLPSQAIAAAAEEVEADLIVVGSRGHGGLTRALLGSVSTALAHDAGRPVLIVHHTRERVEEGAAV